MAFSKGNEFDMLLFGCIITLSIQEEQQRTLNNKLWTIHGKKVSKVAEVDFMSKLQCQNQIVTHSVKSHILNFCITENGTDGVLVCNESWLSMACLTVLKCDFILTKVLVDQLLIINNIIIKVVCYYIFFNCFIHQLPIQGVWPDSGDDKNYTKDFAGIAIDCLRPLGERAKLSDICGRLEVMKSTYSTVQVKSSQLLF